MRHGWPGRRAAARAVCVGALASLALGLASAGTASAHAGLESSVPAPSSVLAEGPDSIVLDFDEPVEAATASIQLFDQDRQLLPTGDVTASAGDSSIILADAPELDDGTFAVVWRVTSIDGHVIDGAFSFQVGTGPAVDVDDLLDDVGSGAQADAVVERIGDIARFVGFVGLVLLLGGGLFLLGTPPSLIGGPGPRRLLATGWSLLAAGTIVAFGAQAAEVVGGSLADMVSPSAWDLLAGTRTGRALLARLAATVVLGALLLAARHRSTVWWKAVAITAGVVALVSYPAGGHAAALSPELLWTAIDAAHLAGVVVWLGGLFVLCTIGRRWGSSERDDGDADGQVGAAVISRFSRTAMIAVPVIVATGVLQTLKLAGGLGGLTDTSWGQVLLVKVAVVLILLVVAGISRWLLQQAGPAAVHRTVLAEAVLGVGVLALAATLVGLPPEASRETQVFNTVLTQSGVIVDVTLTPGLVGQNEVHVVVTPQGGSLDPVDDLTGRMRLPSDDVPAVPIDFTAIGTNHYSGVVAVPFEGVWTLELIVVPEPASTLLLTTQVPIG